MVAAVNAAAIEHADYVQAQLDGEYRAERARMRCCRPVAVRVGPSRDADKLGGSLVVGDEV